MEDYVMQRPKGLVPGSPEWLIQVQGPKLLLRLAQEIESQQVGQMTPTGARLLGMALDRIYPSLQSIHHSGQTTLTAYSDDELKEKLRGLLGDQVAAKFDVQTIETVEFVEQEKTE